MADESVLIMSGFELVDSPRKSGAAGASVGTPVPKFNFEDFAEASPMHSTFCRPLSEVEYECQGISETEKALKDLVSYIEHQPQVISKMLQRRKQEQIENAGLVSFLKARLMKKLQGDQYAGDKVTEEECRDKLEEITNGMMMVYNYNQESKGQRFSHRLAAKRKQEVQTKTSPTNYKTSLASVSHAKKKELDLPPVVVPPPPPPPPPPPCPPPHVMPLSERTNVMSSTPRFDPGKLKRKPLHTHGSSSSINSVHEELLSTNPINRLRSTRQHRSPGGTPVKKKRSRLEALRNRDANVSSDSLGYENPLNSSEPLTAAFMRIMEHKFRNVRSPSPVSHPQSPVTDANTTFGGFTP